MNEQALDKKLERLNTLLVQLQEEKNANVAAAKKVKEEKEKWEASVPQIQDSLNDVRVRAEMLDRKEKEFNKSCELKFDEIKEEKEKNERERVKLEEYRLALSERNISEAAGNDSERKALSAQRQSLDIMSKVLKETETNLNNLSQQIGIELTNFKSLRRRAEEENVEGSQILARAKVFEGSVIKREADIAAKESFIDARTTFLKLWERAVDRREKNLHALLAQSGIKERLEEFAEYVRNK